eukprot:TRINITY_DN1190_c0_g6_i1.p1 TRINITY_DN1190_c0_g6~~TRINITY_DN1190_c0_g6_i1.p1  ORF type:complete len:422 (-),score=122.90 TRINITY_DN1190_c0_g6_i1:191-1456(-)
MSQATVSQNIQSLRNCQAKFQQLASQCSNEVFDESNYRRKQNETQQTLHEFAAHLKALGTQITQVLTLQEQEVEHLDLHLKATTNWMMSMHDTVGLSAFTRPEGSKVQQMVGEKSHTIPGKELVFTPESLVPFQHVDVTMDSILRLDSSVDPESKISVASRPVKKRESTTSPNPINLSEMLFNGAIPTISSTSVVHPDSLTISVPLSRHSSVHHEQDHPPTSHPSAPPPLPPFNPTTGPSVPSPSAPPPLPPSNHSSTPPPPSHPPPSHPPSHPPSQPPSHPPSHPPSQPPTHPPSAPPPLPPQGPPSHGAPPPLPPGLPPRQNDAAPPSLPPKLPPKSDGPSLPPRGPPGPPPVTSRGPPGPPPPPARGPPPPPPAAGGPTQMPAPQEGRGDLLSSIEKFKKNNLKKAVTNDRSAPKLNQ